MNKFSGQNKDINADHASLEHMLEEMEERAHDEEMSNQANSSKCVELGLDRDYTPSYLR